MLSNDYSNKYSKIVTSASLSKASARVPPVMRAQVAVSSGTAKRIMRTETGMPLTAERGVTVSVRVVPLAVPPGTGGHCNLCSHHWQNTERCSDSEAEVMILLHLLL